MPRRDKGMVFQPRIASDAGETKSSKVTRHRSAGAATSTQRRRLAALQQFYKSTNGDTEYVSTSPAWYGLGASTTRDVDGFFRPGAHEGERPPSRHKPPHQAVGLTVTPITTAALHLDDTGGGLVMLAREPLGGLPTTDGVEGEGYCFGPSSPSYKVSILL
jgi:hypothetical protein